MKIKIKNLTAEPLRVEVRNVGDWIDLSASQTVEMKQGEMKLIPLGVAIKLPSGYEAMLAPRSSTFKNFGVMQTNSFGVIDGSYCGDGDEWKMPVIAMRDTVIEAGSRVCQFRVQLSQKATFCQRLRWLLDSSVEIEEVDHLGSVDRGGFGTTGTK